MKPWRDTLLETLGDEREREAADLLRRSVALPVWTTARKKALDARLSASAGAITRARWRAFQPGADLQLPLALVGSLALLVFALVHTRPGSATAARTSAPASRDATPTTASVENWIPVDLGGVGKLRVQAQAIYRLPTAPTGEYRIALDEGGLCAEIAHRDPVAERPLLVETPQVRVFVVGTSFCVETHDGISTVSVTQGKVRVEAAAGTAFVGAGQTLDSNDRRLTSGTAAPASGEARGVSRIVRAVPATPRPPQQLIAAWSAEPSQTPASPIPQVATPPSLLAEENALYVAGTQARDRHDGPGALAAWSSYLARFPQGVLAPEASAGVLGELMTERRDAEALIAADQYLSNFPADGRAAEVAFIRGNLLHDKVGRTADALAAYRQALALATRPGLRDDALFAVGACERMLGHAAAAQQTLRQYQREFPRGAHAGELAQWLRDDIP